MFLIDGYNLLHAMSRGRLPRPDPRRLIDLVVSWCRRGGYRARIVFDPTGDLPRRRKKGEVEIRNVARGRSADEEILAALESTGDRTAYTVVTNDRDVAREAGRHGIRVVSCEDFARDLLARGPSEDPKGNGMLSPGEVDYWMREFGLEDPGKR